MEMKTPPEGIVNKKCEHGMPVGLRDYCKDCQLMDLEEECDTLRAKLDEEQKAHFEEYMRFVKLEYLAMDLEKKLDIAVEALKYYTDYRDRDRHVAVEALKKLEKNENR